MTYEQIEKEFDEWYPDWGTDMIAKAKTATEIMMGESEIRRRNSFKSFLKQSFIKYLKEECEEVKKIQGDPFDDSDDYLHGVAYCKKELLNKLQAQIKELQ